MSANCLNNEIDNLRADAVAHVARVTEQVRREALDQFERDLQAMSKRLREEAEQHDAPSRKPTLPVAPAEGPDSSFGKWLLEPTEPVQVGGTKMHIHSAILRQIPFFSALLDGEWQDAMMPKVELPCSASEFSLILRRLYTRDPLRLSDLPIPTCPAAVRIAAAASMLLIDDCFPELPALLRASIVTVEDSEIAAAAADGLPKKFGLAISELSARMVLPAEQVTAMVANARTQVARDTANSILSAHRGGLDLVGIVAATTTLLEREDVDLDDVQWVLQVARDHLDIESATAVFKASQHAIPDVRHDHQGLAVCHESIDIQRRRSSLEQIYAALRTALVAHVQRCAQTNAAAEAFALGVEAEMKVATHSGRGRYGGNFTCTVRYLNPLRFNGTVAEALAAAMLDAWRERDAIAGHLAQMPPSQLLEVLTDDVLKATGASVERVITCLASDAQSAAEWATTAHLALLPAASRRVLYVGLLPSLDTVQADVAAAVASTLK